MAAGNWILFDLAKQKLWNGTIDLDAGNLRMALFRTSAAITRSSGSIFSQLASEISTTGGYTTRGKVLPGASVKAGASAGVRQFTHTALVFTANGGNLTNVRYAVILNGNSAGAPLVAFAALSTAQFTVTNGNTLTVSAPAGGCFDVSGATS